MLKKFFLIAVIATFSLGNNAQQSALVNTGGSSAHLPSNCNDPSITTNGVYLIYPDGSNPVRVFCDVEKGGWTRLFTKLDRQASSFNKNKWDYLEGFGDPTGNYWMGLYNMRSLVEREPVSLRIEMTMNNENFYAEYEHFYIHPEERNFRLRLGRYVAGNLIDAFKIMNGFSFQFSDSSCGQYYSAGWWFDNSIGSCYSVCLTCEKSFSSNEGHWYNYYWLTFSSVRMSVRPIEQFKPTSCLDIYNHDAGKVKNDGIYNVYLTGSTTPTRVYCEMSKGGWTRILNRVDRAASAFDKSWNEYAEGFGQLEGNHFLGLRNIAALTGQQKNRLRVELWNDNTDREYIEYDYFLIDTEKEDFKFDISGKSFGNLDDAMSSVKGVKFSTFDKRNDMNLNCARRLNGGWWYKLPGNNNCYSASLTTNETQWAPLNPPHPRTFVKMLIKPN